jgi:hypothetical protein
MGTEYTGGRRYRNCYRYCRLTPLSFPDGASPTRDLQNFIEGACFAVTLRIAHAARRPDLARIAGKRDIGTEDGVVGHSQLNVVTWVVERERGQRGGMGFTLHPPALEYQALRRKV